MATNRLICNENYKQLHILYKIVYNFHYKSIDWLPFKPFVIIFIIIIIVRYSTRAINSHYNQYYARMNELDSEL